MENAYTLRFETFQKCLNDLKLAKNRDYLNDSLVLSGMIAKFNMTLDLSWKVLKDIVCEYHGLRDFALGSPRDNYEAAFRCGIIDDSAVWLEMLKLRNRLSHDYNSELAYASCDIILNKYLPFFEDFERSIESYLNDIDR